MQVLAHNLLAQYSRRELNITSGKKEKASEKLSSGYRINRSADDAAGLSISEKMRSQIRGLNRASKNIQDGISLIQVADGALEQTHEILQRINELAIQSSNDTNTVVDRQAIQDEISELVEEINRIANTTSFNAGIYPLRGAGAAGTTGITSPTPPVTQTPPATPVAPAVRPLLDTDYPGGAVQIIDSSTIGNYASYVDSNGKTHYELGSGTFQINGISGVVLDVSGTACLENTNLTNVTINCAQGTSLSVKNVKIDNSGNTLNSTGGVGAAVSFQGNGNTLNCYGDNEFNGGLDHYVIQGRSPYYPACAGIRVGDGAELEINGTETSKLLTHACDINQYDTDANGIRGSMGFAIGSNKGEDGGTIAINSGNVIAYANINETEGNGDGCIGGGNNTSITINGGSITAYGGTLSCIGGGTTDSDKYKGYAEIVINGGTIHAYASNAYPAIGFLDEGAVHINGGVVNAYGDVWQAIGIGGGLGYVSGRNIFYEGSVFITGGTVNAVTVGERGAAIGFCSPVSGYGVMDGKIYITGGAVTAMAKEPSPALGLANTFNSTSGTVSVYIDNILTDATGTSDGNGYHVYTYPNQNTNPVNPPTTSGPNGNAGDIWIQAGSGAFEGLWLQMVDATASALGVNQLDASTYSGAQTAITLVQAAIDQVSGYRSSFGAQQNRLEHAMAVDDCTAENTQYAESRIRDADMAEEMMAFSRHSILEQAGQAVLSQANQVNRNIMQLLQ